MSNVLQGLTGLALMLSKLEQDGVTMLNSHHRHPGNGTDVSEIAMIVPGVLCGGLIGRAGATLRSFEADSGAKLSVSSAPPGCCYREERVFYITGNRQEIVSAVALIGAKVSADPLYKPEDVPLTYPSKPGRLLEASHHETQGTLKDCHDELSKTLSVPEEAIGAVIGRHGCTIQAIRDRSGAKVKIDDSSCSKLRQLTVQGSAQSIAEVEKMVAKVVEDWKENQGPTDGRRSLDGWASPNNACSSSSRRSIDVSRRFSHDVTRHQGSMERRRSIDSQKWTRNSCEDNNHAQSACIPAAERIGVHDHKSVMKTAFYM